MTSAIPVPGQPGRLWLPGVAVVEQNRKGNMKISSISLGQMVALNPALAARAAAVRSGDLTVRQSGAVLNPALQAAIQRSAQADTTGIDAGAASAAVLTPGASGFNWKSPLVLGGSAAVLLGGLWWYKRRR